MDLDKFIVGVSNSLIPDYYTESICKIEKEICPDFKVIGKYIKNTMCF